MSATVAREPGAKMSDCLHCEINDLVQERIDKGDVDIAELSSMVVQSLVELIMLAPDEDRANLIADALSQFGQIYLEKSGAIEGSSGVTH